MYPLIKELQRKIEKTYGMDTGIANIEQFVIGDMGYKIFYANEEIRRVVDSINSGAQTLIRDCGKIIKVSIYYPDKLIKILEENDPRFGIHDGNIDAFASFVEELDHFLFITHNFKFNRPFSLLELELQANITKYLVLKYFMALQNRALRLTNFDKEYIRHHLFYKRIYDIRNASELERYEDAKRFSMIYIRFIDMLPSEDRLRDLRRFSRMACTSKISYIRSIRS